MKKFLNFLKNPKIKMVSILAILIFIYSGICAFSYAQNVSTDIANSVFRLHVIANSDSKEDQDLKYKVRDNLLEYMNTICKDCTSKSEAISLVEENKEEFKKIAENTIKEEGYSYSVNINIGNFEFPTKNYGDIRTIQQQAEQLLSDYKKLVLDKYTRCEDSVSVVEGEL